MAPDITVYTIALLTAVIGYSFGEILGKNRAGNTDADSNNTRPLQRDKDWTTVVYETHDGYGIALHDVDGGVDLVAFDSNDQIYNSVWLSPDELDAVANELSVKAVEKGGDAA